MRGLPSKWRLWSFVIVAALAFAYVVGFTVDLFRANDCACADWRGKNDFTLLNPFRIRQPEQVAQKFLAALQQHKCAALPKDLFSDEKVHTATCSIGHYPLGSWELRGRTVDANGIGLGYAVAWGDTKEKNDPIWIQFERTGGRWQIVSTDTYY